MHIVTFLAPAVLTVVLAAIAASSFASTPNCNNGNTNVFVRNARVLAVSIGLDGDNSESSEYIGFQVEANGRRSWNFIQDYERTYQGQAAYTMLLVAKMSGNKIAFNCKSNGWVGGMQMEEE